VTGAGTAAATSCRAVPVESKTITSAADVRPGFRPVTISPGSPWTSSARINPAITA